MAKTLSVFYLPNRKLNRRNCNGLTDSSTLQIANDPKLILNTRTGSVKMDLEIREFNFLKSQYPADTTKSLYYVIGFYLN